MPRPLFVIPAEAGIQDWFTFLWIPDQVGNENMKVRLLSAKGIIALNNKSRKEAHDEGVYSIGQS